MFCKNKLVVHLCFYSVHCSWRFWLFSPLFLSCQIFNKNFGKFCKVFKNFDYVYIFLIFFFTLQTICPKKIGYCLLKFTVLHNATQSWSTSLILLFLCIVCFLFYSFYFLLFMCFQWYLSITCDIWCFVLFSYFWSSLFVANKKIKFS